MITLTINNQGDDPTKVITIFSRDADGNTAQQLMEAGSSVTLTWDPNTNTRYEVVPWLRLPPA